MKTRIMTTSKAKTAALIMAFGVFLLSCSRNQSDNNEAGKVEKVSAPAMDLHAAAYMGDLKACEQHVKAGTDLNAKDAYGSTPLNVSIVFGRTDAAIYLINAGADLNLQNADGSTPLHTAAFFGRIEIVKALIENEVDFSIRNNYGSTAYETVSGSFEDVKGIYDQVSKDLGALGLKLDYEYLKEVRPKIAALLKQAAGSKS